MSNKKSTNWLKERMATKNKTQMSQKTKPFEDSSETQSYVRYDNGRTGEKGAEKKMNELGKEVKTEAKDIAKAEAEKEEAPSVKRERAGAQTGPPAVRRRTQPPPDETITTTNQHITVGKSL